MKVLYTVEVTATGDGRNGHVTSTDRLIDVDVARPVEIGEGRFGLTAALAIAGRGEAR